MDYYTQFIQSHAGWEFVKVYTDEGISGLGIRKRDGFNEMIDDAMSGVIDLIVGQPFRPEHRRQSGDDTEAERKRRRGIF